MARSIHIQWSVHNSVRALKSNLRDIDSKQTLPFAGQFSPYPFEHRSRLKFDQRTGYFWFLSGNIMLHWIEGGSFTIFELSRDGKWFVMKLNCRQIKMIVYGENKRRFDLTKLGKVNYLEVEVKFTLKLIRRTLISFLTISLTLKKMDDEASLHTLHTLCNINNL